MDKAAIFTDVTHRNALRKANGLPLLDVHVEYAHEVSVTCQRDYRAACDDHADEREAIRQQVIAEYREHLGSQFGQTTGGRWAVGQLAHKRFTTLMAHKYAVSAPNSGTGKHILTYGGSGADSR